MGKGNPNPVDNLTPWRDRLTAEERRALSSKAGRASVKAKAEKKKLADYLLACLQAKTETGDVAGDLAVALIQEALNGNVSAWQTIRDTIGQKVPEGVEITSGSIKITIGDDE